MMAILDLRRERLMCSMGRRCGIPLRRISWKAVWRSRWCNDCSGARTLNTTAGYLHVRQERLGQIKSPLQLLDLNRVAVAKG